jgi:hypothetical protein
MHSRPHAAILVTCTIATFAVALWTASAQPAPDPSSPSTADRRTRIMALDTDRDGRWSRAEWLAGGRSEQAFATIDADHDGFLSQDELRAGMAKMRQAR